MSYQQSPLSPDIWLREVFASKAVQRGEVIRCNIRGVERYAGLEVFRREIQRRGFRAVENGGQIIIFCNPEPTRCFS